MVVNKNGFVVDDLSVCTCVCCCCCKYNGIVNGVVCWFVWGAAVKNKLIWDGWACCVCVVKTVDFSIKEIKYE